jgi:hypothetical protein
VEDKLQYGVKETLGNFDMKVENSGKSLKKGNFKIITGISNIWYLLICINVPVHCVKFVSFLKGTVSRKSW